VHLFITKVSLVISTVLILLACSERGQTAVRDTQSAKPSELKEWQDPEVFAVNKLPMRASFFAFNQDPKAFVSEPWEFDNYLLLNGTWKFKYSKAPKDRPEDFYKNDYDVSDWDDIPVPANWQLQGYGVPNYINTRLDFTDTPVAGELPENENPVGSYKRSFEISEDWQGQRVYLHLGAVKSEYYVWLNGNYVGFAQDDKSTSEFDVTGFAKPGENEIAIEVYRW